MAAPKSGGFKMSLGALKTKPGLKSSPAQKDTKKTKLLLGDDEPDDSNTQQEITGWDAAEGGALDANEKKEKEGPRIIPALPNRDWRAEARRKHLAKAPHQQSQTETKIVDESKMEEPKVQYGLTIIKKDESQEIGAAEAGAPEPMEMKQDNLTEEQRLEKKALDALISGKSTDNDLVIPVQTEEDAFLNDVHNAPDAPTLEAYEATPIEGFGAALLRGMGWKDGEEIGKNGVAAKPKEIKRRPALLGIGAKEEAAVGVELGEWSGGKSKGKKVTQIYNPVTLRNKHTGEVITEEELKAKLERQSMIPDEKAPRSKSRYHDDSEDDERRREKRREKRDDRDRDRDRDRRRDGDYDSERRKDKDRRRDKDDYYDSDRRRDNRKDRAREDDYDSERRREKRRERSRSPDDRRDKRRDRYRSRSRDSKRKSDRKDRSRSRDSDDRKKRRRDKEYDDEDRYQKKRHRDNKYYK